MVGMQEVVTRHRRHLNLPHGHPLLRNLPHSALESMKCSAHVAIGKLNNRELCSKILQFNGIYYLWEWTV